jgi:hypothetical protein
LAGGAAPRLVRLPENLSRPLPETIVQLQELIELSQKTRATAMEACIQARAQISAARETRRLALEQRARAGSRPRRRRVVVYLPNATQLARVCRELAGMDCEIFATCRFAEAAAEIASNRAIDLLVTEETLSQLPRPVLLH